MKNHRLCIISIIAILAVILAPALITNPGASRSQQITYQSISQKNGIGALGNGLPMKYGDDALSILFVSVVAATGFLFIAKRQQRLAISRETKLPLRSELTVRKDQGFLSHTDSSVKESL